MFLHPASPQELQTTCPYHSQREICVSPSPSRTWVRNQAQSDHEMPQLQDVINQPREEQPGPSATQSPIGNLPPETLSLIFQHACSQRQREGPPMGLDAAKRDGYFFVLVLCAVSVQWRQIARSTPQLWDIIYIEVTREGVNFPS